MSIYPIPISALDHGDVLPFSERLGRVTRAIICGVPWRYPDDDYTAPDEAPEFLEPPSITTDLHNFGVWEVIDTGLEGFDVNEIKAMPVGVWKRITSPGSIKVSGTLLSSTLWGYGFSIGASRATAERNPHLLGRIWSVVVILIPDNIPNDELTAAELADLDIWVYPKAQMSPNAHSTSFAPDELLKLPIEFTPLMMDDRGTDDEWAEFYGRPETHVNEHFTLGTATIDLTADADTTSPSIPFSIEDLCDETTGS